MLTAPLSTTRPPSPQRGPRRGRASKEGRAGAQTPLRRESLAAARAAGDVPRVLNFSPSLPQCQCHSPGAVPGPVASSEKRIPLAAKGDSGSCAHSDPLIRFNNAREPRLTSARPERGCSDRDRHCDSEQPPSPRARASGIMGEPAGRWADASEARGTILAGPTNAAS